MSKILIIGTGYLSEKLSKQIIGSKIYSASKLKKNLSLINKSKKKIKLIINSSYSSRKLNNLISYKIFIEKSILEISEILDSINPKLIEKIIYTSSSSVYGSINNKINISDPNNRFIYSSLKLSGEMLFKNFCNKKNIDLDICRIFNLYGPNDNFSIISKLKSVLKNKKEKIIIYNEGDSMRDFIHVDDVIKIYKKTLSRKGSNIIDIGTGKGLKVIDILNQLKIPKNKIFFKKTAINEVSNSIANNENLIKKFKIKKFKKIENHFHLSKQLNYFHPDQKNYIENSLSGSIIYGAGFSGIRLEKQFNEFDQNQISYFVDDDPKKIGQKINNIKVISFHHLKKISTNVEIRNIIIAIPSLSSEKKNKLIKKLIPLSTTISSLPEKSFYKQNKINYSDVDEISLDELFNKENKDFDIPKLNIFRNKNILVTGGAGSIGTEISRQINYSNPKKIIILDHSELNIYRFNKRINNKKFKLILGDIKDENLVKNILKENKIDYIFHAAAYKHVKFLEGNIYSAIKNNIFGTYSILKAIKGKSIKLIFISTDKAVKPKNILGITKRIGELLIKFIFSNKGYQNSKYFIVRFGNVIGSDGSALPYFLNQIKNNLPILLTDKKMERYFMSIREACNLVLRCSTLKNKNDIFFLDMGKPVKILDVIKKMFKLYKKPGQRLKVIISGNKYNEKLSEILTHSNKIQKTAINKIFSVKDKLVNKNKFYDHFKKLIYYMDTQNIKDLNKMIKIITKN